VLARDEAEGEAGDAEDRRFERAGDRARIGGVVAEVASVVDAGAADVGHLFGGEYLV
jgi:hypothetical protein